LIWFFWIFKYIAILLQHSQITMKKITLLLFFVFALLLNARSQAILHTEEWHNLITSLQAENWQDANTISLSLLNKISKDEPDDVGAALLRYMYIHSEAGLMNLNKVTKDEAIKAVKGFTGKWVLLPAHPVALKNGFNSIQMVNGKTDSLFITSTNNAATEIFSFDYIILDEKWPVEDFKNSEGEIYRLGGIIRSITVEGNMLPRFRIIIEKANAQEAKLKTN